MTKCAGLTTCPHSLMNKGSRNGKGKRRNKEQSTKGNWLFWSLRSRKLISWPTAKIPLFTRNAFFTSSTTGHFINSVPS